MPKSTRSRHLSSGCRKSLNTENPNDTLRNRSRVWFMSSCTRFHLKVGRLSQSLFFSFVSCDFGVRTCTLIVLLSDYTDFPVSLCLLLSSLLGFPRFDSLSSLAGICCSFSFASISLSFERPPLSSCLLSDVGCRYLVACFASETSVRSSLIGVTDLRSSCLSTPALSRWPRRAT
jgi:hypothetical protein